MTEVRNPYTNIGGCRKKGSPFGAVKYTYLLSTAIYPFPQ